MEIYNQIDDVFSLLSIMLVFSIMFNSLIIEKISNILNTQKHRGDNENKKRIGTVQRFFAMQVIPMAIVNIAICYINMPLFIKILKEMNVSLLNFDIKITSFVFIFIFLLVFVVISIYQIFIIVMKIKDLKKE